MNTNIIFPRYHRREIIGDTKNVELEGLPPPVILDLTRWKNKFRDRSNEQLRQVETQDGIFIEARLSGSGHYNGALSYGSSVIYNINESSGEVNCREYLLEPTSFTPKSQVTREATAKITQLDIKSPKNSIEDALILEGLKNDMTLEQLGSLYIRKPMFFTNEIPATWYAMRDNGDVVDVTSFHTRWRDIFIKNRKILFGIQKTQLKKGVTL